MPRSILRPQRGSIVWYYAALPPVAKPLAAIVVNTAVPQGSEGVGGSGPTVDLTVFNADGTTAPALGVPFFYGTRPASGAGCTAMRVNEPPTATSWPGNLPA